MERLTQDGDYCQGCTNDCMPNLYPERECIWRKRYSKLRAYEDTGLEPEEAEACKVALMGKTIAEIKEIEGLSIERMKERAKAEAEGRLVVLPCKVGQEVFRIRPGHCEYREQDMCCAYCDGWDYECTDYEANMELELGRFTLAERAELIKLLNIHVKPIAKVVIGDDGYSLWNRIEYCLNSASDVIPADIKGEKI